MILAGLSAMTAGVALAGYATFVPTSSLWGKVISRRPGDAKRIALTFDDGPTPGGTDRILDVLKEADAKATFFVIGENAKKNPDLLRRIHDEGHLIGNHSWRHEHYAMFRGPGYWTEEFERTNELITAVTGAAVKYFRPPMGIKTPIILGKAKRNQMFTIAWTHRAHDGFPTSPEKIIERLTTNISSGSILLIHDGVEPHHPRDPNASVQSVRPVIENLRGQGFKFCRIDELLKSPSTPRMSS